jgi:hypothetical protein
LSDREPVQIVEIDIDYCSLTYGTGACTAVLGTTGVRKCYNTFRTCQATAAFDKVPLTLRFANTRSNFPKGQTYFPVLQSVTAFSSSVNIAGSNPKLGNLGKRAKVTASLVDFPYHDRYTDKYQEGRIDGTAQTDEGGYDPMDRGTFFTKLKNRFPYYAGRPMRVIDGYISNGELVDTQTRHFIVTDINGPDSSGRVSIEGKDVLTLADKKSSLAPTPSRGTLSADISEVATSLTLVPSGIGAEYPTSGYAVIGSEIVTYTRSGDNVTLTARGVNGSEINSHNEDDTFQEAINYEDEFLDDVIYDLFVNYAGIPASYIDTTAWNTEVQRWAPTKKIFTTITEPTGVADLVGELAVIGVSIWWDDVNQKIGLRITKPPELFEIIPEFTDDANIKEISQEDRDEDRLTQIHFYTVQADPTQEVTDKSNYNRIRATIDTVAEQENAYNDTRVREVFFRWFNTGNDTQVRLSSLRLLQRLRNAPKSYTILLDAKDRDSTDLTDVIRVTSRVVTDETGKSQPTLLQVTQRTEKKSGHEVQIMAQSYQYDGKYGWIMQNTANVYGSATELEKESGGYIVDGTTLKFPDNEDPYVII